MFISNFQKNKKKPFFYEYEYHHVFSTKVALLANHCIFYNKITKRKCKTTAYRNGVVLCSKNSTIVLGVYMSFGYIIDVSFLKLISFKIVFLLSFESFKINSLKKQKLIRQRSCSSSRLKAKVMEPENVPAHLKALAEFVIRHHSDQLRSITLSPDPKLHYPLYIEYVTITTIIFLFLEILIFNFFNF